MWVKIKVALWVRAGDVTRWRCWDCCWWLQVRRWRSWKQLTQTTQSSSSTSASYHRLFHCCESSTTATKPRQSSSTPPSTPWYVTLLLTHSLVMTSPSQLLVDVGRVSASPTIRGLLLSTFSWIQLSSLIIELENCSFQYHYRVLRIGYNMVYSWLCECNKS